MKYFLLSGEDETSRAILNAIEDENVSSKLEGPNFVSIHLTSGTQTFNQFSEICILYRPVLASFYALYLFTLVDSSAL